MREGNGDELGYCDSCDRVRWLAIVTSEEGFPHGVCRTCLRDAAVLAAEVETEVATSVASALPEARALALNERIVTLLREQGSTITLDEAMDIRRARLDEIARRSEMVDPTWTPEKGHTHSKGLHEEDC